MEPCLAPQTGMLIGVIDAVDLALCKNPLTREIWANARAQAAQVGVAQAAYLPNLDGKANDSRVTSIPIPADNVAPH